MSNTKARTPYAKPVRSEEVGCLGPLAVKRPHKFPRPKGSHERICPRCKRAQDQLHLGETYLEPVRCGDWKE